MVKSRAQRFLFRVVAPHHRRADAERRDLRLEFRHNRNALAQRQAGNRAAGREIDDNIAFRRANPFDDAPKHARLRSCLAAFVARVDVNDGRAGAPAFDRLPNDFTRLLGQVGVGLFALLRARERGGDDEFVHHSPVNLALRFFRKESMPSF